MVILPLYYPRDNLNLSLFYVALEDEMIVFDYRCDWHDNNFDSLQYLFVYKICKTISFNTIEVAYTKFVYC